MLLRTSWLPTEAVPLRRTAGAQRVPDQDANKTQTSKPPPSKLEPAEMQRATGRGAAATR